MSSSLRLGVLAAALGTLFLTACNENVPPLAPVTASASASAGTAASGVAATVNGQPIALARLNQIMQQQSVQGMPDTPETRKMVIDNLALQMLAAQEAQAKGLDKQSEVAEQLEMARQSILANAFVRDFIKSAPVNEEALKAEYDKAKGNIGGKEYKARHILVADEKAAQEIIAKLRKDAHAFEALAKAQSQDPGSKGQGGDLGWFDARSMVPEFSQALAKMEKGHFTETPVKTQYGYHVILLEDLRDKPMPTFEQLKPGLSQQVQQQTLKRHLDELKAKAKIEVMAAATPAAAASAASAQPPAASAAASAH